MKNIIKSKISLIFITFYFSFFSEILITFLGENKFYKKYFIYFILAIFSFYIYRKVGEHTEEAIAHEFFSSMFAISLVYLPITVFCSAYNYWLFLFLAFFLLAYPFLYLNKCCMHYSKWYKKKRETSKRFKFWTIEPYDIKDAKRTFNFNNVYIGSLITTIMYVFQLYTGLDNALIPMFYVYIFYLFYIFLYLLFISGHIFNKTFPAVDLMIVLLASIFYMTVSSYFVINKKNQSKKSKICMEYIIGKSPTYLTILNLEKKTTQNDTLYVVNCKSSSKQSGVGK